MPRPKKAAAAGAAAAAAPPPAAGSSSKGKLGKELGKLLAARAAYMDEEDDESIHGGEPYYTGGFGTRRGTVCHCARCLRRSGPVTDDPGYGHNLPAGPRDACLHLLEAVCSVKANVDSLVEGASMPVAGKSWTTL